MADARDFQRSRVYRAEWDFLDEFDVLSLENCWEFVIGVILCDEFRATFPCTYKKLWGSGWDAGRAGCHHVRPNGRLLYLRSENGRYGLRLRPGYRRRSACSLGKTITLPVWSRNKLTILHELAHLCTWYDEQRGLTLSHHGADFTRNYLALVRMAHGHRTFVRLRDAMFDQKVRVGGAGGRSS